MQRIFTTLTVLLSYINSSSAQLDIGETLLQVEEKVYAAQTDSVRMALLFEKTSLYVANNITSSDALKEFKRINYRLLPDLESKIRFLWNGAIVANLNNDRDYAQFYYNRYLEESADTSLICGLLGVLINNGEDSSVLMKNVKKLSVQNSYFSCLTCLTDVANFFSNNTRKWIRPVGLSL